MTGIGTFDVGKKTENGAGMDKLFSKLFPTLPEFSANGNEESSTAAESDAPQYGTDEERQRYRKLLRKFEEQKPAVPYASAGQAVAKAFASQTVKSEPKEESTAHEDEDLLSKTSTVAIDDESEKKEGFVPQKGFDASADAEPEATLAPERLSVPQAQTAGHVPLNQLGLDPKEINELCRRFSVVAAQHCYGSKVEPQFVDKCRGYYTDCAGYIAQAKPLGAIANSFGSSVGITYYDWGVKGIPYYAVNEEGAIGNGHNGKVDFGTYGGGYSDVLNVRDYWTQTAELGRELVRRTLRVQNRVERTYRAEPGS